MFKSRTGMALMICAGLFAGIANISHAQYGNPGSSLPPPSAQEPVKTALGVNETGQERITVKALQQNPVYDQEIVLKGKITRKTGKKEYRFDDDTGNMKMIIEDKLFSTHKISDTTRVEITGVLTKMGGNNFVFNALRLKVIE